MKLIPRSVILYTQYFGDYHFSEVFQNNFTSNLMNLLQYREEQKRLKRSVDRENQRQSSCQSVEPAKPYWSTAEDIKG